MGSIVMYHARMDELGHSFSLSGLPFSRCHPDGCARCDGAIVIRPLAGPPAAFPLKDGLGLMLAELGVSDDGTVCVRPARELAPAQKAEVWAQWQAVRDRGMSAIPAKWIWDQGRGLWTTTLCVRASSAI